MWAKQQCGARACCRRRVFLLVPLVAGLYELGVRAACAGLLSVEMLDSEIEKAARSRDLASLAGPAAAHTVSLRSTPLQEGPVYGVWG